MSELMNDTILNGIDPLLEGAEEDTSRNVERFLTFLSDGITIAVSTSHVMEIIANHAITELPMVPSYIKGIINLRGQIIPILDIRLRMGKMPMEYDSRTCIIVMNIDSIQLGIVVDTVYQVVDIDKNLITPIPIQQQELLNGMISSENLSDIVDFPKTIMFLDCEQLIAP